MEPNCLCCGLNFLIICDSMIDGFKINATLTEDAMATAPLQRGPERACWGGGVTIINGSPAMLMVRRTIGFILRHMLPTEAQTGPESAGAPLFGLAHNHPGTRASQGHGCVCALKCVRALCV